MRLVGTESKTMESSMIDRGRRASGVVLAVLIALSGCAGQRSASKAGAGAPGPEKHFKDPKVAVAALLDACRTGDEAALLSIFGEAAKPIISTGNAAADRERCQRLLDQAGKVTRLDPKGADRVELVVGTDDWPFPI